jgi:hypothetical protein
MEMLRTLQPNFELVYTNPVLIHALSVALLEHSLGPKFAEVVTDRHADKLVHNPDEERDHEPTDPCPAAEGEHTPVAEIEDQKRQDVTS